MSPVVAAEHSRNCPGNLLLLLVPSQAGPPDPPTRGPRHIHSFHWVCPFQLGKAIWILFKRLFILEKKRQGISGLLMKSGPWWYCWWRACSVSWSISSCVRGLCRVCFKLTWVLKWLLLGSWVHQSPTSADICCSLVRRCLTVSAYMGRQANFQWNWKETHSQGHHACLHHVVSISAFAKKKKKRHT